MRRAAVAATDPVRAPVKHAITIASHHAASKPILEARITADVQLGAPMARGRRLGRHPVPVPRYVRPRRTGWRLYLAPGGMSGLLAPVVWCLVMLLAGVLVAVGVAVAVWPFVAFVWAVADGDASDAVGALFGLFVLPCVGGAIGYGAICLWRDVWDFAVAVHRVDIHPAADPARLEVAGWMRGSVIEIADLSWVLVRSSRRRLELVLCVGDDRTVVCPAPVRSGPPRWLHPSLLADWLRQTLAFAEIPVAYYRSTLEPDLARAGWLGARIVAPIWRVAPEDVPAVADRYGVRTAWDQGEPRFAVDDVEWCAQWAGSMSAALHDETLP
jgi:hypothetical protein